MRSSKIVYNLVGVHVLLCKYVDSAVLLVIHIVVNQNQLCIDDRVEEFMRQV